MTEPLIIYQKQHLGFIRLNRPQALNALTFEMIKGLQQQLSLWENDDSIHAVILLAEGEKAFCAGGDIRWLVEADHRKQMQFFEHEYRLNHFIHRFTKPYIPIMNGITMGGGVGVSLHGSHPIATERFLFAMPETGIGFFPDIGASYLLSRCPGAWGIYLGLTGTRLNAYDAHALGLIQDVIPSNQIETLIDSLLKTDLSHDATARVRHCLTRFHDSSTTQASILQHQHIIDTCFSLGCVQHILSALKDTDDPWALQTHDELSLKSPLSLKVTLAQLQKAKALSMAECVTMDYCLVHHFVQDHDFYEGVRALLVDKDKSPHWEPSSLKDIPNSLVNRYFDTHEQLILHD